MIYEMNDPSKAAPLFSSWEDLDTSIVACLDNVMGRVLADDPEYPKSAMAVIGDFAFCAGEPSVELVAARPDRRMIVVPQDKAWEELIENNFPANKQIRYSLKKETEFNREKLEAMARALPEGYSFHRIDGDLYDLCLEEEEFEDNVSVFESKEKYLKLGRGFVVMKDGEIASAASSYSRCLGGIDIVIATGKEARHKGLASAVAAKLILECLNEGLYPAWDAANKMSVRLAEKLGYQYSREYVCFSIE